MKRILLLTILLVVIIAPTSVQAAGSVYSVWLYEQNSGRMTLVNQDGDVVAQFILPATTGSTYAREVAVSPDGNLIAYSTTYVPPGAVDPSAYEKYVSIYDYTTGAVIYSHGLPGDATTSLEMNGTPLAYDPSGSFAFGYAAESVGWEIVVIDLTVFDIFTLTATDSVAVSAGLEAGFGYLLPVIQRYDGTEIVFTLVPTGTEGAPRYAAYTWNMPSAFITPNKAYVTISPATAPVSGEVVLALNDTRFSNSSYVETGFPIDNTLQFFDPLLEMPIPFVHTPTYAFYDPEFVQAGERILVQFYDPFANERGLQLFERSGVSAGGFAFAAIDATSTAGLTNGLLYTTGVGSTTLFYVETRGKIPPFALNAVWNSSAGAEARIMWTSDDFTPAAEPLMAWGRLAVPDPSMGVGGGGAALGVGGRAAIFTTEGDTLRMRSGPGTGFAVVRQLPNGTLVTILEGPNTDPNGLTWWRVRTDIGVEGWVVEEIDGIRTLVPGS